MKPVVSMRGVPIDTAAYLAQNETTVALGNASMNARGDVIGRGGEIVKTRDQIAQEYHRNNPNAVKTVSLKNLSSEVMTTPTAPIVVPETPHVPQTATVVGSERAGIEFVDPDTAIAALGGEVQKRRKIEDR